MDTIGQSGSPGPAVGRPRLATAADLAPYLELRDAAARWQLSRGIDQWRPGEWAGPAAQALAAGELWVLDDPDGPPGALLAGWHLQWSDAAVWPEDRGGEAGYVHGLVVGRAAAGRGLGRVLLEHAREQAATAGRPWLRLDCRAANRALRGYYTGLGFTALGERWRSWPGRPEFDASLALFEAGTGQPLADRPSRHEAP